MEEKTNPTNNDNLIKTETPVVAAPVAVENTNETPDQINWRKFREVRDKERKEKEVSDIRMKAKEEEAEALKAALEAVLNKPQPNQSNSEPQEEDEIQKRIDAAIHKRDIKYQQDRAQEDLKNQPAKLKGIFPDFEKVTSQDNVDYLEFHHPEAFEALRAMPDSFEKWSKVYNAIKRYIPNTNASKDAAKATKNLLKPQSMSTGLAQSGDASPIMALNAQRKSDNWARIQRTIKGVQ